MEKRLIQGNGKQAVKRNTCEDLVLKEFTKLDMADASQLATDRDRWREIRVTAAQIAPPD